MKILEGKKLRFKNIPLTVMFINCLYIVNDVILMLIIISLYREGKELMKPENSSYYDQFSQPLKR